jgi:5-methylcytosine-specific restriction endonuclease McrA
MSTTYNKLLSTPQWRKRRIQILKRDNYACRSCGSTQNLHVHHRQYHYFGNSGDKKLPWDYTDKYLITLCSDCHSKGHAKFQIPIYQI